MGLINHMKFVKKKMEKITCMRACQVVIFISQPLQYLHKSLPLYHNQLNKILRAM